MYATVAPSRQKCNEVLTLKGSYDKSSCIHLCSTTQDCTAPSNSVCHHTSINPSILGSKLTTSRAGFQAQPCSIAINSEPSQLCHKVGSHRATVHSCRRCTLFACQLVCLRACNLDTKPSPCHQYSFLCSGQALHTKWVRQTAGQAGTVVPCMRCSLDFFTPRAYVEALAPPLVQCRINSDLTPFPTPHTPTALRGTKHNTRQQSAPVNHGSGPQNTKQSPTPSSAAAPLAKLAHMRVV